MTVRYSAIEMSVIIIIIILYCSPNGKVTHSSCEPKDPLQVRGRQYISVNDTVLEARGILLNSVKH